MEDLASSCMSVYTAVSQPLIQANLDQFLLVVSVALGVISLSRFITQFREIPYTIILVIAGLGLAIFDIRLVTLSPEFTVYIFLPPLLFITAWNIDWQVLRGNLGAVALYAIGGSLLTIAGVGAVLTSFGGFSLDLALIAGACLTAVSPTPVILLFRQLGVEPRLTTLTQSENLFSSCLAIATFIFLTDPALDLTTLDGDWINVTGRLALGAVISGVVGSLVGLFIVLLRRRSDMPFLERSLLLACAYGSYSLADDLGGSGAISVVVAGIIVGNLGITRLDSVRHDALTGFLNFIAFFVNSIVFLLIGNQVNLDMLVANLQPIGLAISTVLVARGLAIYGLGSLNQWFSDSTFSWQEQTLLWWTGLRGSLSIALALSVPIVLVNQEVVQAMVLGVVLFTLLVQGLTTKPLLSRLSVIRDPTLQEKYMQSVAQMVALSQTLAYVSQDWVMNLWQDKTQWLAVCESVQTQLEEQQAAVAALEAQNPALQAHSPEQIYKVLMLMETGTYLQFMRAGMLHKKPSPMLPTLLSLPSL